MCARGIFHSSALVVISLLNIFVKFQSVRAFPRVGCKDLSTYHLLLIVRTTVNENRGVADEMRRMFLSHLMVAMVVALPLLIGEIV